jgi:predicted oxidoreductase
MKTMGEWLCKLWCCWIWRIHDWTCAAEEGVRPTKAQVEGGVAGFFDYAKMYCRRCGRVSKASRRINV